MRWFQGFTLVFAWLLAACVGVQAQGQGADAKKRSAAYIIRAEIAPRAGATCFRVTSIGKLIPEVYAVGGPDRVVIDAANAFFRLPRRIETTSGGLVGAFRYGLVKSNDARIVVDVAPGTQVVAVNNTHVSGQTYQLSLGLVGSKPGHANPCGGPVPSTQTAVTGWSSKVAVAPQNPPRARSDAPKRPVVIIDPGHGGLDPGAVVNKVYLEKRIVLEVAKRLTKHLRKDDRFRAVMTRSDDKFIALGERIERTRAEKGDLFISLHADSIDDATQAAAAKGAAVYVLSHRASNAEAKRLADKENAVDLLAGILPKPGQVDGVRNILVDLLKRETERESSRLQKLLVAAMRRNVPVSRQPIRAAAFQVLKQTETPAALIELGYMTNPRDLRLMRQAEWQERMAASIARAIEQFFRKK